MNQRPIVLCDLDGIVADLLSLWLERYREDTGENIYPADITSWDIHECTPHGHKIYDYIRRPGLFDKLQPMDGAVEGVKRLNEFCDLIILSTPSRAPVTATEKIEWCHRHLPFLERRQIMLGHRKELVFGDYFIDDSPDNLTAWAEAMGSGCTPMTIDYPYNRALGPEVKRFYDFENTADAWTEMVQFIRRGG